MDAVPKRIKTVTFSSSSASTNITIHFSAPKKAGPPSNGSKRSLSSLFRSRNKKAAAIRVNRPAPKAVTPGRSGIRPIGQQHQKLPSQTKILPANGNATVGGPAGDKRIKKQPSKIEIKKRGQKPFGEKAIKTDATKVSR